MIPPVVCLDTLFTATLSVKARFQRVLPAQKRSSDCTPSLGLNEPQSQSIGAGIYAHFSHELCETLRMIYSLPNVQQAFVLCEVPCDLCEVPCDEHHWLVCVGIRTLFVQGHCSMQLTTCDTHS